MLTLINTNRMVPPIAPVGLDYVAAAARRAGIDVHLVDLLKPTFYIASALGRNPARLVRELIGGDPRFCTPEEETGAAEGAAGDHNYNANQQLVERIAAGERGAYWDILRRMR